MACRVLNVSRSGYNDKLGRPASTRSQENVFLQHIEKIHNDSRRTYGSPRARRTDPGARRAGEPQAHPHPTPRLGADNTSIPLTLVM